MIASAYREAANVASAMYHADVVRLMLGREPRPGEADEPGDVARRLLVSPEFRDRYFALVREPDPEVAASHLSGLAAINGDERFVELAYECLLGRPADPDGRQHYLTVLRDGTRLDVLTSILLSDEFDFRYVPAAPFVPRDVQLCELANPAKWDNPDWMAFLRELRLPPPDKPDMHRKGYELTQLIFGLHRLGGLRADATVVSIGAGHECVLYWLANRVGHVIATDTYQDSWSASRAREGDATVLGDPKRYAPFPYRESHLTFMRMDGRRLAFADASVDVAYSLSSIEHFGGLDGAADALDDMARIVRPGGLVVVATEYRLSGPRRAEVFEPDEIHRLFSRPGLELVEPVDDRVYQRYRAMPVDLIRLPYTTPHMVVKIEGTVFTSVIGFMRKRQGQRAEGNGQR